jgi:Undecaprenyl-phosphate galactose phosphotransferase WbaP
MGVLACSILNAALSGMSSKGFSRTWWAATWFSLLFLVPCARHTSQRLLRRFRMWHIPTIIIGNGENAKEAYLALKSEPTMGFEVKAFVTLVTKDNPFCDVHQATPVKGKPVVVVGRRAQDFQQLRPFHCVIALEAPERELRDTAIRLLNQNKINDVHVIPSMRGVPLYGMETAHFFSHEVLLIQLRNNLANPLHRISKRAFDLVGSISLLLLLSPLLGLLVCKVSKDGGNPFFGHMRVGQNDKPFKCYKFRSMVLNAQEVLKHVLAHDPVAKAEWDRDFKLKNDPRISKLGKILRRTSLDELPQLFNVLKGEMSLVGPRPVVQAELERYGEDVDYYLMAKPGMTGLWQVSGRNDVDYTTRVYLDSWYVKNWSLWSDIAILFKTISVVTKRSGAY